MKTLKLHTILLACILMLAGGAQTLSAQFISLGIKGGMGGNFHYNSENSFNGPSPQVGLFAIYSDQNHLGIGTEVLYTEKVSTRTFENFQNELKTSYLEIPVLGYYFFGKFGDKFRPKVFAGPHVSVKVYEDNNESLRTPRMRPLDFGMTVGGGINIAVADRLWFNGDLRYSAGFLPSEQDAFTVNGKTYRNQFVSVLVGFAIGLEKIDDLTDK